MHIDLDLTSVYYFIWSLSIFISSCMIVEVIQKLGELIQKMTGRMDDLLVAIRTSLHTRGSVSQV